MNNAAKNLSTLDDSDLAGVGGARGKRGMPDLPGLLDVATNTDNSPSYYGGIAGAIAGGKLGAWVGSSGGWVGTFAGAAIGATIGGFGGEAAVNYLEDVFDGDDRRPLLNEDDVSSYMLSGSTWEEVEAMQKGGDRSAADARKDAFYADDEEEFGPGGVIAGGGVGGW